MPDTCWVLHIEHAEGHTFGVFCYADEATHALAAWIRTRINEEARNTNKPDQEVILDYFMENPREIFQIGEAQLCSFKYLKYVT